MNDRRHAPRARANVFANQYIDGIPHLSEVLELSMTGALVRRVHGPNVERATYAVELASGPHAKPTWLCASSVWRVGEYEAVRFVQLDAMSRLQLAGILEASKSTGSGDAEQAN